MMVIVEPVFGGGNAATIVFLRAAICVVSSKMMNGLLQCDETEAWGPGQH